MEFKILGNEISSWIFAIGTAIAVFLAVVMLRKLAFQRLAKYVQKTETKIDDMIVELLSDLKLIPLFVLSIYSGSNFLDIPPKVVRLIELTLIISILIQSGIWGNRIIKFFINSLIQKHGTRGDEKKSVPSILRFLSRLVLWSFILLLALDNLGVNITALLAGLGVGGIAVALSLQNILGDLFASLSITLDRPFEIGDFIVVGEFMGTVEHIGLKTTRIRSLSGEENIFSNTDLLQSRIRNYKRMSERRIAFGFGVTYQTASEKLKRIPDIVHEIIDSQKQTRFDRAHFKEFGDSSLNYEVVYYVLSPEYNLYMDIQQNINIELYERFEREKIDFAYPTRTLIVEKRQ